MELRLLHSKNKPDKHIDPLPVDRTLVQPLQILMAQRRD
jgi:hypothetical protein